MVICAVAGCSSSSAKTECVNLSFFSFPTKDKEQCEEWRHRCAREDGFNLKFARICSLHFSETDLDASYVRKVAMGFKAKACLKPGVLPSLHLPARLSRWETNCMENYQDLPCTLKHFPSIQNVLGFLILVEVGGLHSNIGSITQTLPH